MAFSSQGDRIALTQIEQMIDGKYVLLGHYDIQADNLSWTGLEKWNGNKVIKSTKFSNGKLLTHTHFIVYDNITFPLESLCLKQIGCSISPHTYITVEKLTQTHVLNLSIRSSIASVNFHTNVNHIFHIEICQII